MLAAFAEQATSRPWATALVATGRTWTFAQLDVWSSRLARVLHDRGIGRGDVVALAPPRELMAPSVLAVLRSGAACLPLEGHGDTVPDGAALVIGTTATLAGIGGDVPGLALDVAPVAGRLIGGVLARPVDLDPDDAAYVLHTPGAAGGAARVVPHRAIAGQLALLLDGHALSTTA